MKKLLFILFLAFSATTFAQTGIGTTTPNASAQLDVTSTTKGFLPPRMTEAQRSAISGPATGLLVYQTDATTGYYFYDGASWTALSGSSSTPAGTVSSFAGSTAPAGYLICDGSAVSRTSYAALFAVIGTTYGAGDGSTTFNLPDLQGKNVMGYNAGDASFNAMGYTGGEKTHTLTAAELASHNHSVDPPSTSSGNNSVTHTHSVDPPSTNYADQYGNWTTSGAGGSDRGVWDANKYTIATKSFNIAAFTSGSNSANHTHTTDIAAFNSANNGGGNAHNVLDPYLVLNYIIKY